MVIYLKQDILENPLASEICAVVKLKMEQISDKQYHLHDANLLAAGSYIGANS